MVRFFAIHHVLVAVENHFAQRNRLICQSPDNSGGSAGIVRIEAFYQGNLKYISQFLSEFQQQNSREKYLKFKRAHVIDTEMPESCSARGESDDHNFI